MPMQAYKVECLTCGWSNRSADYPWTKHAGEVHTKVLKPGHILKSEEPEEDGAWIR